MRLKCVVLEPGYISRKSKAVIAAGASPDGEEAVGDEGRWRNVSILRAMSGLSVREATPMGMLREVREARRGATSL